MQQPESISDTIRQPTYQVYPSMINLQGSATWPGKISLMRRILGGKVSPEEIDRVVDELTTPNSPYFVAATRSAPLRCVDGRPVSGYDDANPALAERPLGPQVVGGTGGLAAVMRLAAGWPSKGVSTYEEDLAHSTKALEAQGGEAGGYTDNHSDGTGCGAIDRVEDIVDALADPLYTLDLEAVTSLLLGDQFDGEVYDSILGKAVRLRGHSQKYFKKHQEEMLTALRKPGALEELTGSHEEELVIINFVPETTFHRDRFSARHQDQLQAAI